MSSNIAQALEHSSRVTPEGEADPKMLLVRTLIVHTPDVASVVSEIEKLESLTDSIENPMIKKFLEDRCRGYWRSLASLSSVNGKMLDKLTTTTQSYTVRESKPEVRQGISQMLQAQPQQNAVNN